MNTPIIHNGSNILIMKPSSLGDIIHTIPVVQAIKRVLPSCHVTWFVLNEYEDLVRRLEAVDETIAFYRDGFRKSPIRFTVKQLKTSKKLFRRNFEWVLDFQGLFRSGLFGVLTFAPNRFGFSWKNEPNRIFYTHFYKDQSSIHAVERYMKMVGVLGIEICPEDMLARFKAVPLGCISWSKETQTVVLCPGGRWETKRWGEQNYASLAQELVSVGGIRLIIIGNQRETGLASAIAKKCNSGIIDLAGKTSLGELVPILQGADVVVSNDSGPMHLAASLGTRVVAIFGPTDPAKTGPYGREHTVLCARLSCQPCFKRKCERGHACMTSISVEEVFGAVREVLNKSINNPNVRS